MKSRRKEEPCCEHGEVCCSGGLVAVALLGVPSAASALLARGHVLEATFGGAASVDGELERPSGVAVSESSGDVYVVDSGKQRVDVFRPTSGGYKYASEFSVRAPGAITVDNSTSEADPTRGDVYVAGTNEKESQERNTVYEYSPRKGEIVHRWKAFRVKEEHGESGDSELELEDISVWRSMKTERCGCTGKKKATSTVSANR